MQSISSKLTSTHIPAQDRSYRVPSPPHILIPSNPIYGDEEELRAPIDHLHNFESNGFVNTEFLKSINFGDLSMASPMLSWKYENRRTAQRVLPFLYLGPVTVANDMEFLQSNGITLVLAVRDSKTAQAKLLRSKVAASLGIESRMIDVAGNQELIAAFPEGIQIINSHLSALYQKNREHSAQRLCAMENNSAETPGKVLVYCETGNERSALLVAAYIMAMFSLNVIKAIQVVQAQRFAVGYDDYSKHILQAYDSILRAKRDVLQANSSSTIRVSHGKTGPGLDQTRGESMSRAGKRSLDEISEDCEMGDYDHDILQAPPGRQGGLAPFQDGSGLQRAPEKVIVDGRIYF